MASSSERSPPPFPDSEDQDVLDTEDVGRRDSDEEDLFMSALSPNEVNFDAGEAPLRIWVVQLTRTVKRAYELASASGGGGGKANGALQAKKKFYKVDEQLLSYFRCSETVSK